MAKRMLIDATHPEETRVVVLNGNRLEEFDFEIVDKTAGKRQHLSGQGDARRTVAAGRLCRIRRQSARLSRIQRDPPRLLQDPGRGPAGWPRRPDALRQRRPADRGRERRRRRRGGCRRGSRSAARNGAARAGSGHRGVVRERGRADRQRTRGRIGLDRWRWPGGRFGRIFRGARRGCDRCGIPLGDGAVRAPESARVRPRNAGFRSGHALGRGGGCSRPPRGRREFRSMGRGRRLRRGDCRPRTRRRRIRPRRNRARHRR